MLQREFSDLQDELENVVVGLRISKEAKDRRELLYRMRTLIDEADAILTDLPAKPFRTGTPD